MKAGKAFCSNLKRLVDAGDVSILPLSKAAGVSRSTIYTWLDGSHVPNLEQMEKVAEAANRSVTALLFGESKPGEPAQAPEPTEDLLRDAIRQLAGADERTIRSVLAVLKGARAAAAPKKAKPGTGSAGA